MITDDDFFEKKNLCACAEQPHPLPSSPLSISTSQQMTHQAPPSQGQSQAGTQNADYAQYNNRGGVTTGPGGDVGSVGVALPSSALVNQKGIRLKK